MEKKSILVICLVLLVFSSSLVSAGFLQDIGSWLKDFFTYTEEKRNTDESRGTLASLGALATGSGDYGSGDYVCIEGERGCYDKILRGGGTLKAIRECINNAWIDVETCQPNQGCIEDGLDAQCTCIEEEKRCYTGGQRILINGVEECRQGIWIPIEKCEGNCSLGECEIISQDKCSDGTSYGSCSTTPPLYCKEGNLIEICGLCGCPENKICAYSGKCIIASDIEILSLTLEPPFGTLNSTFFEVYIFNIYVKIKAEEDYISKVILEISHENNLITSLNLNSRGDTYHSKWIANNILEGRNDYTFRVIVENLAGEEKQRNFTFSLEFSKINPDLCEEIIEGHNNPDANRANLVFVGYGYKNLQKSEGEVVKELGKYVLDLKGENQGLLSVEPFKSNKDKFNFWYVDKTSNVDSCESYGDYLICESSLESNCVFSNKYIVKFVDKKFRSSTLSKTYSTLSAEVQETSSSTIIFPGTLDKSFVNIFYLHSINCAL